jgi:hypothetical protein
MQASDARAEAPIHMHVPEEGEEAAQSPEEDDHPLHLGTINLSNKTNSKHDRQGKPLGDREFLPLAFELEIEN